MVRSREQIEELKQTIRDRLGLKVMVKQSIRTIKGTWVICKKVRKVPFYHIQGRTRTTQYSRRATQFTDKAQAEAVCKEINDKRKATKKGGHKFRVEDAEKHFVNDFRFRYVRWNRSLSLTNELHSIQRATKEGARLQHSVNHLKDGIVGQINQDVTQSRDRVAKVIAEAKAEVEQIEKEIKQLNDLIDHVKSTDLDETYIQPNLTAGDRTVAVLYGNKPKETEVSQASMMLLPLRK